MKKAEPQKLCRSCEGTIPLHSLQCPYCGTSSDPDIPSGKDTMLSPPSHADFLHTLYPSSPRKASITVSPEISPTPTPTVESPSIQENSPSPTALYFLLPGSALMLFGIMVLLFSEGGALTLIWQSHYGIVYSLLGCSFVFLGLRQLRRGSDE